VPDAPVVVVVVDREARERVARVRRADARARDSTARIVGRDDDRA